MNVKHAFKLVIPFLKHRFERAKETYVSWKRIASVDELMRTRERLKDKKLEYERKNTEESLKYAFAVEKQIEIINQLLGGKRVI